MPSVHRFRPRHMARAAVRTPIALLRSMTALALLPKERRRRLAGWNLVRIVARPAPQLVAAGTFTGALLQLLHVSRGPHGGVALFRHVHRDEVAEPVAGFIHPNRLARKIDPSLAREVAL